jgi:hypothetical protein
MSREGRFHERPWGMAAAVACAAMLQACDRGGDTPDTRTLGGYGEARSTRLVEVDGRKVSPPPAPRNVAPQLAAAGPNTTVAVWLEDGRVVASRHHPVRGWEPPAPLETIGGQASPPQLAGNGRGVAMAVWRHSVGAIDSLRYARFETRSGWTAPDVLEGALPRAPQPGKRAGGLVEAAAPRIEVDESGNARAQWQSGFKDGEIQVSTYVAGEGWSRPLDLPATAAAQAPASAPGS